MVEVIADNTLQSVHQALVEIEFLGFEMDVLAEIHGKSTARVGEAREDKSDRENKEDRENKYD